jgi:hypothetical protein
MEKLQQLPAKKLYSAFLSYATDPDKDLARDVETFLENLNKNKLIESQYRRTLQVCLDGSDFKLPPVPKEANEASIQKLVAAHLEQADYIVLIIGPKSKNHRWINWELDWWLTYREPDTVLVAVSHGDDPVTDRVETFPPQVIGNYIDRRLWFDFRG